MPTPSGYADVSIRLNLATMARPAFLTYGINPVDTDAALVAQSQAQAWLAAGSMNTRLDQNVTAAEFIVRLGTDGGGDIVGSHVNTTAGAYNGTCPPPNVATLVHKRTARGGRRGRGRLFLPWMIGEANVDEAGIISPSDVTTLQAACTTWLNALSAATTPMVLLHREGKTVIPAPDPVVQLSVGALVATQRRRLGRR